MQDNFVFDSTTMITAPIAVASPSHLLEFDNIEDSSVFDGTTHDYWANWIRTPEGLINFVHVGISKSYFALDVPKCLISFI